METIYINSWGLDIKVGEPLYDTRNSYCGYWLLCSLGGPLYFFYPEGFEGAITFDEIKYSLNPS